MTTFETHDGDITNHIITVIILRTSLNTEFSMNAETYFFKGKAVGLFWHKKYYKQVFLEQCLCIYIICAGM